MAPARFPAVGAQIRRRTDGILGEVYATDPPHNLLSVCWPTVPGAFAREDCTPDQFTRSWELTGARIPPPRETHVAIALISALVLFFLGGIVLHDSLSRYRSYDPLRPLSADAPSVLRNAQALDRKYGLRAAESCSGGADDYIRSITPHLFRWEEGQALTPRFDQYSLGVSSPGVLTMISTRARISDGFGTFSPIKIYCNYDTQNEDVLSYTSEPITP